MQQWQLGIALDPDNERPLFLQLAERVAQDIGSGRLRPGDALPGTRALARSLRINRNTVVAGYAELVAEGLVGTRAGGGTFVAAVGNARLRAIGGAKHPSATLPCFAGEGEAGESPTYQLAPASLLPAPPPIAPHGALLLSVSTPDVRLFPARELARAFRRALAQRGRGLPGQADSRGHVRLRAQLANLLVRSRGLAVTPENLMITRSIEQAIDLVARTLIAPGDVVAVEEYGYPPAWNVLQLAGARLVPVAIDREGLDVDALERVLARERVRAVFLTPHHQFPTTAVMSARRRARLAALALAQRFAIIEDDYDHEFHYSGKPILPIAAGPGRANTVYIGSLANLLAPGIGTAFIVAPPAVFERIWRLRAVSDARGDAAIEGAIAELFEDGELARHTRRMCRTYAARRDCLADALRKQLGSALSFDVPDGGMALWARADAGIDLAAWEVAAAREGVVFRSARAFHFEQREQQVLRLGFSYLDEPELAEAARRMARALVRARPARSIGEQRRGRIAIAQGMAV